MGKHCVISLQIITFSKTNQSTKMPYFLHIEILLNQVEVALSTKDEVIIQKVDQYVLRGKDFKTLKDTNWLNDEVGTTESALNTTDAVTCYGFLNCYTLVFEKTFFDRLRPHPCINDSFLASFIIPSFRNK